MYTDQMVDIMYEAQQYCPKTPYGNLQPIPFGGDGLSVIKSFTAKRSRLESFHQKDKLAGLIPKPEDWHAGVIVLQVCRGICYTYFDIVYGFEN